MGKKRRKPHILLAPCLASDEMFSIKKYQNLISAKLNVYRNEFEVKTISPIGQHIRSRYFRAFVRYVIYPTQVALLLRRFPSETVLHVTGQFYAHLLSSECPCVITCHDLVEHKYHELTKGQLWRWRKRIECLKRARTIFAVSRSTAHDLRDRLEINCDKVIVNYEGVDKEFCRLPENHSFSDIASRLIKYSNEHTLVLHVGTNHCRKNMSVLLNAVSELRKRGLPILLVKIGDRLLTSKYASLIRELGVQEAVVDLGHVTKSDLVEVYNVCNVFVFPSLYEGFGFPLLEAQASGLPCVVADTSSLPELGAESVLYHKPEDVQGLVNGVLAIVNERHTREELIKRGLTNVKRFSWDAHVDCLVAIYRQALEIA